MHPPTEALDPIGVAWRLGATFFFVVLNGFFVAAEFALVKVRAERIQEPADRGQRSARAVQHMLGHLDLYLSACQLGITLASLVLGALGEPAVSRLIVALAQSLGVSIAEDAGWLPIVSLLIAFAIITILHMTLGEQAPKMMALRKPEPTALATAMILRVFTFIFRPFIILINNISNWLLRLAGLPSSGGHGDAALTAEEIRSVLSLSAGAGEITDKEFEITQNVFRMIELEVRHIMVPRVEVEYLSLARDMEKNFALLRDAHHSRFPLCKDDLDSLVGVVHGKDVLTKMLGQEEVDLQDLSRDVTVVPDTMPLVNLLLEFQSKHVHLASVVDEHGTTVGLAFREDALEEIVGPLGDEFDDDVPELRELGNGVWEAKGSIAFPDLCARLDVVADDEGEETLGGYIVAHLTRLPTVGDEVALATLNLRVTTVDGHRITRVRIEPGPMPGQRTDPEAPPEAGS